MHGLEDFATMMIINWYKQSEGNHNLFLKHSTFGGVIALLFYAEDKIMIGNDKEERDSLRKCLARGFEIKELGRLKYFLGI